MRQYGTVNSQFWITPKTKRLSTHAKLLYLYLRTSPHTNSVGCFYLEPAYAQADLGWNAETVSETIAELFRNGLVLWSETLSWVYVVGLLADNPPANPNTGAAMAKMLEQIPDEFDLFSSEAAGAELLATLERFGSRFKPEFVQRFQQRFRNGSYRTEPNRTDPEPKPEPNQIPNQSAPPKPDRSKARAATSYAFEGQVIHLTAADYDRWRETYSAIPDLRAELTSIDAWYAAQPAEKRKAWFHGVSSMLNRKHQEHLAKRTGSVEPEEEPWERERNRQRSRLQSFANALKRGVSRDDAWMPVYGAAPWEPGCGYPRDLVVEVLGQELVDQIGVRTARPADA